MQRRMKVLVMALGLAAVLLVTSGVALAIHSNPNEFHACYNNSNGLMFFVSNPASCNPNQTAVTWNQAGPQGPQGAPGPQGPQGAPGPQGTPGISGYQRIFVLATKISPSPFWEADVTCPAGKKVISGGYHTGGSLTASTNIITLANGPSGTTGAGDVVWQVRLYDPGDALNSVSADVICANVQ